MHGRHTILRWTGGLAAAVGLATQSLASEGAEKPSLFASDVGNIVFTAIIFGLVVFILGKFAWGPLLSVLQQRENNIRDALENARRERQEADKLLADYRRQIDRAREEATAVIEEGKRDAEVVRRRIQDEARKEADETLQRARREIQLATDTAVKELYDQAAILAVQVAGGIIKKELRPDDHRALIDESVRRMRQDANGKN